MEAIIINHEIKQMQEIQAQNSLYPKQIDTETAKRNRELDITIDVPGI